jgi:protein tyrosine phosphatase (PTP) superfamily phosphohydrolase (DUF442 family)
MNVKSRKAGCLFASLIALLAGEPGCSAAARGVPAQNGILNFGKVSEGVYRGAQPDAAGVKRLQELGIKTIINLRMPKDSWSGEALAANGGGIIYTNVPLRGFGRPTDEQVRTVLAIIDSLPGPVFIHCRHGCDRTGTIVACYRMQHDHWALDQALKEASQYGFSWLERGMKGFVQDFGKARTTALASSPSLPLGSQSAPGVSTLANTR